jgi:hypothetical protein
MKVYYRYTKFDLNGGTIYELNISYQSYTIAIYFIGTHLPYKRLARKRPLDYFKVIREDTINLCVAPTKYSEDNRYDIEVKDPDMNTIRALIKCAKTRIQNVKIKKEEAISIINKFCESLL